MFANRVSTRELRAHDPINFLNQLRSGQVRVNAADTSGMRPIQVAAMEGFEQVVLELLAAGADTEIIEKSSANPNAQKTALYHALEKNHDLLVQILIICGQTKQTIELLKRDGREDLLAQLNQFTVNKHVLVGILYWLICRNNPDGNYLFKKILSNIEKDLAPPAHEVVIEISEPLLPQRSYLISASEIKEELYGLLELAAKLNPAVCNDLRTVTTNTFRTHPDTASFEYWRITTGSETFIYDSPDHIALTLYQLRRHSPAHYKKMLKKADANQLHSLNKLRLPPDEGRLTYSEKIIYEAAQYTDAADLDTFFNSCQNDWPGAVIEAVRINNLVAIRFLANFFESFNKADYLFLFALEKKLPSLVYILMFHCNKYPYDLVGTFRNSLKQFFHMLQHQEMDGLGLEAKAATPDMTHHWRGLAIRMMRHANIGAFDGRGLAEKERQHAFFNEISFTHEQFFQLCGQHVFEISPETTIDDLSPSRKERLLELANRCGIDLKNVYGQHSFYRVFHSPDRLTSVLKSFLDFEDREAFMTTSRKSYRLMQERRYVVHADFMAQMHAEVNNFSWWKNRCEGLAFPFLRLISSALIVGGTIASGYEMVSVVLIQNGIREKLKHIQRPDSYPISYCDRWFNTFGTDCSGRSWEQASLPKVCEPLCTELTSHNSALIGSSVSFSLLSASLLCGSIPYIFKKKIVEDIKLIFQKFSAGNERFSHTPLAEFSPVLRAKFADFQKEFPESKLSLNSTYHECLEFSFFKVPEIRRQEIEKERSQKLRQGNA